MLKEEKNNGFDVFFRFSFIEFFYRRKQGKWKLKWLVNLLIAHFALNKWGKICCKCDRNLKNRISGELCSIIMFRVCFHNFLWFDCIVSHRSTLTKTRSQSMKHQQHLYSHVLVLDNSFSHTWRTPCAHTSIAIGWTSPKCCFSIDTNWLSSI